MVIVNRARAGPLLQGIQSTIAKFSHTYVRAGRMVEQEYVENGAKLSYLRSSWRNVFGSNVSKSGYFNVCASGRMVPCCNCLIG